MDGGCLKAKVDLVGGFLEGRWSAVLSNPPGARGSSRGGANED